MKSENMIVLSDEGYFHAAHKLPGYKGKCENLHGHTWKYKLLAMGEPLEGFLFDFSAIKQRYDHKYLNEILEYPSAENIIEDMAKLIRETNPKVKSLELWLWENPFQENQYIYKKFPE